MKQIFNAAVICVLALAACTTPFKKAKDGTEYKIISTKSGAKVVKGNFIEVNSVVKYKDSILNSTFETGMPQYALYDTAEFPSPYKEIFVNLHVGDSIILKVSTDSIIKKSQGQQPPFMQKGQFLYQTYVISNVFTEKEQMAAAQKSHMPVAKAKSYIKQREEIEKDLVANKAQIDKDCKTIEDYLAKNNIKATKTKWGVYIAVQTEGTGPKLTTDDIASVNYTGKTLDSSIVFDSNVDPKFNHVGAYDVNVGEMHSVIFGWLEALMQFQKGTKATIYIPSSLAYGKSGYGGNIKPDQNLIFDIEVKDVTTEAAFIVKQEAEQKKMIEAQKAQADSIQKATKK